MVAGICDLDRVVKAEQNIAGPGCARRRGERNVSGSLTMLVVLITLIHLAALIVMIVIRVRRNEVEGTAGNSDLIRPCAVCGEPASRRGYDGLDPDEQRDPYTGRSYSNDLAYYRPLCAAH